MKKVTVIGLGEMGAAIARVLLKNNYEVTVWNRTTAKAEPLREEGAQAAADVAAAVAASPLVITCVIGYEVTRSILGDAVLDGKTLVEMTTGTPEEARASEVWAHGRGAKYLDGAIAATPVLLGKPDTPIFVSGAEAVFREQEETLKTLGGGLRFVGAAAGAASAFDLGFLAYLWGSYLGFLNSASIFEAEKIPVTALGAMLREISPVIGEMVGYDAELIEAESYEKPQSSLELCLGSTEMILRQSTEAGTNEEISRFTRDFFKKGVDAGYGQQGIAALIKLMRKRVG